MVEARGSRTSPQGSGRSPQGLDGRSAPQRARESGAYCCGCYSDADEYLPSVWTGRSSARQGANKAPASGGFRDEAGRLDLEPKRSGVSWPTEPAGGEGEGAAGECETWNCGAATNAPSTASATGSSTRPCVAVTRPGPGIWSCSPAWGSRRCVIRCFGSALRQRRPTASTGAGSTSGSAACSSSGSARSPACCTTDRGRRTPV